ncbi:MAG: radical SAM protein [Nanoarchaeota archaeon]|nr:radical SAM protein [Nanoarchaeota archaeon]MBU1269443.1 radical SAM protein [Nanoarchaeota archaeon]MBU1604600.1 radical SAM protein [Nanoarchaeota archaeon]MBU2442750.1 radical SAM protein [Nanoarchaeota archaeon]
MDKKKVLVKKELTLEDLEAFVVQAKKMGIKNVLILGGEPFLWRDLFKLIVFCNEEGLDTTVITNGVLLNQNMIKKIIQSKLPHIHISLDGATSETHDIIRGKGVFNKAVNNIQLLNAYKAKNNTQFPTIGTTFTIMKHNFHELSEVVKLAQKLGIDGLNFQPVVIDNTEPRLRSKSSSVWIEDDDLNKLDTVIDKLIELKKQSRENYVFIENTVSNLNLIRKYFKRMLSPKAQPCYAGFNRLHVTQIGTSYLCDVSFGDLKKRTLKEIWFSKEAKEQRKKIKNCQTPCMQFCSYRSEFYMVKNQLGKIFVRK